MFSILAGTIVAILWSVPIGLLGAGVGIVASIAISLCRSPETANAEAKKPRTNPGYEWYADLVEGGSQPPVDQTLIEEPQLPTARTLRHERRADQRVVAQPQAPIVAKRFSAEENVRIYQETMAYAALHFADSNAKLAKLTSLQARFALEPSSVKYSDMRVYVANKSTLRMTQDLVERGLNPLVLDMANAYQAGGGVRRGANAQEEIVCRQSNAMVGLLKMEEVRHFPIPELAGFLLPGVTFFRADPNENYAFLDRPFQADVFALAAYCCIPDNSDRPIDDEEYRDKTIGKIENYFRTAIAKGNDSIVASALGCGAFKNDPVFIAGLFKEVLEKPEFKGQFKEVAFGIIEDANSRGRKGNYQVFKEVLEG